MIRAQPQSTLDLASAWVAGVAGLFLIIGLGGIITPVSPPIRLSFGESTSSPLVPVQEFLAPAEEASSEPTSPDQLQRPPTAEITIPPLPTITPPLQPPEMIEIQAPEPITVPPLAQRPPEPNPPKPEPATEPKTRPASTPASSKTPSSNARNSRPGGAPGSTQPVPFSAAGGGSFPAPAYPSSARSARLEGTVVLLVIVEASGSPTSVEIRTSSGHTILDTAARDHLRRNWRWPSGESRLFLVPIKFVLR